MKKFICLMCLIFIAGTSFAATRDIVPRADSEGGIGTSSKYWASGYFDDMNIGTSVTLPDGYVEANDLKDEDFGDFTVSSGSATLDAGVVDAAAIADGNIAALPLHLRGTVINPNGVYAIDTQICLVPTLDASITITNIEITCDADPATELDIDLKWADAFIGFANAAVIDVCDTTTGTTSISSGFDDADISSSKCIYFEFGAEPDSNITQFSFDITYDYD